MTHKPSPKRSTRKRTKTTTSKEAASGKTSGRQAGQAKSRKGTKLAALIDKLSGPKGATIEELQNATGWQAHSVRGAISGSLKKKLGLAVSSERVDGRGRVYRIPSGC